jgi:hypothetical protein
MSNLLYSELIKNRIPYDDKEVRKSITIIRKLKHLEKYDKYKMLIYNSLSDITIKGVNNFFGKIIAHVKKEDILHTKDDIVLECYCILDKCIENFDLTKEDKQFFFYYNKSVSFGLIRIKDRRYKFQDCSNVKFEDISSFKDELSSKDVDLMILDSVFSEQEKRLIKSRMDDEDIEEYLEREGILSSEYFKLLKEIKSKFLQNFDVKRTRKQK